MKIFKIEAVDDTIYVESDSKNDAIIRLQEMIGPIPEELLTVTQVDELPAGEELL